MARILITYFSDYGETMYDAITDFLRKNGNSVIRFNINCNAVEMDYWGGHSKLINDDILSEIKNFGPDLVLSFNNSCPVNLLESLNGVICVIDADNPETFFNKEYLLKNSERFKCLGLQSYSKEMYRKFFKNKFDENNYLYFPPATVVKSETLPLAFNISFIGSNFFPLQIPVSENFYSEDALWLYDQFVKDYYFSREAAAKKLTKYSPEELERLFVDVRAYYVGQDRLKHMQAVSDLGFKFFGVRWWNRIAFYDFDLAKNFDPAPKTTLADNEWVYNSSKISINISHPQAKSSFSWRVMDIMASSACLLMEPKPDWMELFGKYLDDKTLKAIIYYDHYDLRAKAINLLNDEKLRLHCVKQLNYAIECNGRWSHRFSSLEKFINIQLISNKSNSEFYKFINKHTVNKKTDLTQVEQNSIVTDQSKLCWYARLVRQRTLLLGALLFLFCAKIPFVGKRLISVEKRDRVLMLLNSHWNY